MKQIDSEVLIVGGGLNGFIAAYVLSLLKYRIVITEQKTLINNKSFSDTRTTAIAEGSKIFLEEVGLWKNLYKYSEPIKKIDVLDRGHTNKINFYNNKNKDSNLGYIIKNSDFIEVLKRKLLKNNKIKLMDNTKLKSIEYSSENIIGVFDKLNVKSNLLISADGKNSTVRKLLKTPIFKKNYKESALVLNFTHHKNHNNKAYEFFYKNGPLAILPMQKKGKFYQSSMIWTNKKNYLNSIVKSDNGFLINLLSQKLDSVTGPINKIISKQIFPLSSHINSKFYEKKILYIGDSAHSIHPIAGQGWNLGLRDIKALYSLALEYQKLGIDLGKDQFCKNYNNACYGDSFRMYQITDKLNWFFMKDNLIANNIRAFGFGIIQKNNLIKNKIVNFAMGI